MPLNLSRTQRTLHPGSTAQFLSYLLDLASHGRSVLQVLPLTAISDFNHTWTHFNDVKSSKSLLNTVSCLQGSTLALLRYKFFWFTITTGQQVRDSRWNWGTGIQMGRCLCKREVKRSFIWKTNEQLVSQLGPCLIHLSFSCCILIPQHHCHNQHSELLHLALLAKEGQKRIRNNTFSSPASSSQCGDTPSPPEIPFVPWKFPQTALLTWNVFMFVKYKETS